MSLVYPGALLAVTATLGLSNLTPQDESLTLATKPDSHTAVYEVTFMPSWNPATNPLEYPYAHAKMGLLTPAIGAAHNSDFSIFCAGSQPTPGLERLSEMGKHDPLDAELEAAQKTGEVGQLIRFADGSPGPVHAAIRTTFELDADHSQVSLVGMIAPSPDWFYGVSSVALRQDGDWTPSMVVPAYAWDSGGDGGTTYLAEDDDLQPKQTTKRATSAHFTRNGQVWPVGYFVFKQLPQDS